MTFYKDPEQNETKHLHKFADFAGKRVLEIGCGEGRLTWRYATSAKHITGMDVDKDALRVATIDRPSDLAGNVHFVNAQVEHIPFHKETFDIAILAWSF
jgi:ubiquinone/menaquinone biosynthesis C-methylase UbiE